MKHQPRSVLCLLAHPDDETFICGGTLARLSKRGARVVVVSATRGEMGRRMGLPPSITRESMPAVREEELRQACRHLGIEPPVFLGLRDKTVEYADYEPLVDRLMALIASHQPDVVFTFHPEWGGHPDHCAIGRAAVDAFDRLGERRSDLYFISFGDPSETMARSGRHELADAVRVDVTDSLPEKLRAFRAHRSQTEMDMWLWQPDAAALARFGAFEYFILARKRGAFEL